MRKTRTGFTLIEIAIVLMIVGLLLAGGVRFLAGILSATQKHDTEMRANLVKQALSHFVASYGRLPCPAPNVAPSSSQYGLEDATPYCGSTVVATAPSNAMARGIVPWYTLGINHDQVTDGYGHFFSYNVAIAATALNPSTVSTMRGTMTLHFATPPSLGLPPVGNQINSCMNISAPPAGGDDGNGCNLRAVVVLISHGQNGLGAYIADSNVQSALVMPAPTSPPEVANTDNDVRFVAGEPSASPASYFDDLVYAWSPDDFLAPLADQHVIKSPVGVTNDALSAAQLAVTNAIVANATNTGFPPTTSATVPADAATLAAAPYSYTLPKDGWGNALVYQRQPGMSDACGHPAGTQLVKLTSLGIDGVTGVNPATNKNDDITLYVTSDPIQSQLNNRFFYNCP